jgi:hypothetical protein
MTHTVTYNPDPGVIHTIAQGKLTLSEAKEIITEIAQLAIEKNCFLCLSDYRQVTMEMTTLQIHDLPKILSTIVASLGLRPSQFRRAIIAEKDSKDYLFFETVTLNNAQQVRLFQDVEEAKKWLLQT